MDPAAVKQLHETLQRYAGWLDRQHAAMMVRADIRALGTALDTSTDPVPMLQALDAHLGHLPGGDLRKMLRVAADQMRRALSDSI